MESPIDLDKVLVTGAGGLVGHYLRFGLRPSRDELDVTNLSQVEAVVRRLKPKAILHLAALTDMAKCEEDKDLAYGINAVGTYNVALAAREVGAKLVYVSTNAVFDGNQDRAYSPGDAPHPANVYGHSKYLGELAILGMSARNLVVRSSWIFGGGPKQDKKFVGKVIPKFLAGDPISAVNDVRGTPTYGKDLAAALREVVKSGVSGVIHVTNGGDASRYDMALVIKESLLSRSEVSGAPLKSFGYTGNALRNEMLDSGEYKLRPWPEALKEYLETEWKT